MKNCSLVIILSLIIAVSACKKENRLESKLEGTWELRHLIGFVPPDRKGDRPPGNGDIYTFKGNNFERLMGGIIIDSGTFLVLNDISNYNEKLQFKLVLDGDKYDSSIPFKMTGEKLVLHFGALASDGAIETYARLSHTSK